MDQVLYFRADWCGPCRQAAKVFEQMKANNPAIEFVKVDVDEDPSLASKHQVRAVPTMIYVKDGKEVARVAGARSEKEMAQSLGL